MTTDKAFHSLRAEVERDGINFSRRTGRVSFLAIPSWLKQATFVRASLSPKQARALAVDLLIAAAKAEEGSL